MRETLNGLFESAYTSTHPTQLLLAAGVTVTGKTRRRYKSMTKRHREIKKQWRTNREKKLRLSLSNPSGVASYSLQPWTSASSLAAHREHILVDDSLSTAGPGAGQPNPK